MELTLYQSKENKYFAIYLSKYSYSVLENQLKSQKKKKKKFKIKYLWNKNVQKTSLHYKHMEINKCIPPTPALSTTLTIFQKIREEACEYSVQKRMIPLLILIG